MKTNSKEMKGKIVDASERRLGFEVSVYEMWTRKNGFEFVLAGVDPAG